MALAADPVEGLTTYGTGGQRYEAAVALRRERYESPHYLIDVNTGDYVIAVWATSPTLL